MSLFDSDRWDEIFNTMKKNKMRTFLTAFGVFWGIFMLIIMLGSGNGLENGVLRNFGDMATNSVFIWTRRTSVPYAGLPEGRWFSMKNEDMIALQHEVPEIEHLAPRNQLRGYREGNNVSFGTKAGNFSVMGDHPQIANINPMSILQGRFINHLDIEDKRKVTVIGTNVRDVLFGSNIDPINQNIKINGVYFKVIGVWKSKKTGNQGERDSQTIYIPFSTFQKAFNYGNYVGWLAVTAKEGHTATEVEEKIVKVLKRRHKVAPHDDRAFGSFNAQEEFEQFQGLFGGIATLIWVVGTGTLIAGIIGVSNIMLIVVKERTKEMGIRKALGATPGSIISMILTESIFLTSISGYLGLIAGTFVIGGIDYLLILNEADLDNFHHPTVNLTVGIGAILLLIIAGTVAGLIPALQAARVRPVIALKDE